jgi:hypothetical protein
VAFGTLWSQAAIAVRLLVLPEKLALGNGLAAAWWYQAMSWTLLVPVTSAARMVGSTELTSTGTLDSQVPLDVLLLAPLVAVVVAGAVAWALARPAWRGATAVCVLAFAIVGVSSGVIVASQLRGAALAQRAFFALVSSSPVPHADKGTVAAAREFAHKHPESRWAGEALRIVAMAQEAAGLHSAAAETWSRFGARFVDRTAPGVAYSEYNVALCDESLGRFGEASAHYRVALGTIRTRGDGIQSWIAQDAAKHLAALERERGHFAMACYWSAQSRAFSNVHPID